MKQSSGTLLDMCSHQSTDGWGTCKRRLDMTICMSKLESYDICLSTWVS